MRSWRFFLSGLLIAIAVVLVRQWQTAQELRGKVAGWQAQQGELVRLRAEHRRLVAAQVSAEEMENLRSDHAIIIRLRGELEGLKEKERGSGSPRP